ncbi:MAG: hotdog domain-containing protein [Bacteroidota bacterium]|nr:hotdog domain-containing protein [Bacteroidota bacterium]MDP4234782.1 hotdog domain-containing protein [Bacteroidota bacterium]MDP4244138.1 hotdog domain-containing protein [Bacteroidota bacterium]MDP4289306.1 hotdog domain-containing protein [Bacteroidota bacterium]
MKIISKKICMARDIGIHRNMFGGILMAWIDEAGVAFATEYCSTPNMVTLRVGELLFKKPLKTGDHVRLYGDVEKLGNTSITVRVEVRRYSLYSGEETLVCTTSITFVRIDDDGSPTPIGESIRKRHEERMEIEGTIMA